LSQAVIICRVLFKHLVWRAFSLALAKLGKIIDAKIATIAMTTNNSMSVNAWELFLIATIMVHFKKKERIQRILSWLIFKVNQKLT